MIRFARGALRADRCLVMGILNVTPDSFSDGGRHTGLAAAMARVDAMVQQGADIIDIGGESTRPGHTAVHVEEELRRVLPVVAAVRGRFPELVLSVDTRKAEVALQALRAGADIVNDVSGLEDPAMPEVVADAGAGVVVMRHGPIVGPLLEGCREQLAAGVLRARSAGVPPDRIVVDPGLGFGDPPGGDVSANMALLSHQSAWSGGFPVLVGASRKRFVGALGGAPVPERRVGASVAVAFLAAQHGASFVRVHDVEETVQALRVAAFNPAAQD